MTNLSDAASGEQSHDGYVLPAENAAEMARLMLQDHLITQAMGGPLPEQGDLAEVHDVLDIACGPGGWVFDLAQRYPHIRGVGVDISKLMIEYASSLAVSEHLANVEFRVMDVTQPLQFPDESFDLVNARILTGFLAAQQWPALLRECYRLLRPGGILRLTEAEWRFTNSAALDKLSGFSALGLFRIGHSFSPHGRTMGTSPMLGFLIQQAGCQNVEYKANVVNYSTGTEFHESNVQNHLVVCKLLQPFLAKMQIATMEELQHLHAQAEQEMQQENFCAVDYYLTAWGRKP